MGRWRRHLETWLAAEQEDHDDAAEAAFADVFTALPPLEPSPAFVARTVEAAWAARVRRRWVTGLVVAAAAVLLVGASGVALFVAIGGGATRLLTIATALASGSFLSLLTAGATLTGWSAAAVDAGAVVATAIANPYSVAALTAIELVAAAVLVMLHRLLRADVEWRTPRAYCF
jgi:hypothetical protein